MPGFPRVLAGVAEAYREVAAGLGCPFFDAGSVVQPSGVDGVHLDAAAHLVLADALADVIRPLVA
jgi:lysophospholipase L1-like esterase